MRDEKGLSNGVQLSLIFPLAFSVLLLTLQWALVSWAEATALAAAQDGARVAAGWDVGEAAGRTVAGAAADNGSLNGVRVSVDRGAEFTVVTVSGEAVSVIPGWAPGISRSATRATERVTSS